MGEEIWKDVVGYEGYYAVSNYGRVKSLNRIVTGRWGNLRKINERIIFQSLSSGGYLRAQLCKHGGIKFHLIHRLVLLAFVGPCPDGMEACHFPDRDTTNNRLDNLRWATVAENTADKAIHGTILKGEAHGSAKLTELQAVDIVLMNGPHRLAAQKYGLGVSAVGRIRRGESWRTFSVDAARHLVMRQGRKLYADDDADKARHYAEKLAEAQRKGGA